jgi:hypothetical protein
VTRPSINSFCNALEEDGELTAVLVLSNDMVQVKFVDFEKQKEKFSAS